MIDGVRAAAGRHPRAVDTGVAALVAVANVPSLVEAGTGGTGWMWLCAVCLPLVWRRRAPVLVFCVVAVLMAVSSWSGAKGIYPVIAVLVAVYALARHRPWRYLPPPVVLLEVAFLGGLLQGDLHRADFATLTSLLAATALLGVTRRAYQAGREERAERLEQERDQRAHLAVVAERARIAREVHDIVAHNLAVMVALSDGAAFTATLAPRRAADTMEKVSATGREALAEMRRLLGLLRDGEPQVTIGDACAPAPQPGLDDVDRLLDQVRAAGVEVTLIREGVPGRWGPGAGLTVYRIVQEALTNTIKHAGPHTTALVRLSYTTTEADLEVTDGGGSGRPVLAAAGGSSAGHGLAGMSERVASYGGHVEAGPRPGGGWRVRARLRFDDGGAHGDPTAAGRRPADAPSGVPHGVRNPA
ncbi:sensor histidine kinase [Microbispora sp. NPDC049125]|uniref:sensor histidine kinase n=1 Tax=Microbispora sp. NPDC049125 TaxID=3154929 RepID=UPI00346664A3